MYHLWTLRKYVLPVQSTFVSFPSMPMPISRLCKPLFPTLHFEQYKSFLFLSSKLEKNWATCATLLMHDVRETGVAYQSDVMRRLSEGLSTTAERKLMRYILLVSVSWLWSSWGTTFRNEFLAKWINSSSYFIHLRLILSALLPNY